MNNWQTKKLGEVLKLEYGKPLDGLKRKFDGKYILYGANGEKDRTDYYYYDKPSIIVGRKGSAGELKLTEAKFWPLDVTYFITFDNKKYDLNFLYYLLLNLNLPSLAKGVKPGINRNEVYSIDINIPDLVEQKKIVSVLDEAFEKIEKVKGNTEKNLQNSKDLFESYLNDVFYNHEKDWEEKEIKELFVIMPPKKEVREKFKENDLVSFVPMEDLGIGIKYFVSKKERKLKEVLSNYTYFINNDVLLAKITPCFENGKIGIASDLKNGVGFGSSEYIVFRSKESILSDFIFYFLNREVFRNEGAKKMSGAVGHKRVSKEFIENTKIPFPSTQEQKQIVKKLDQLSEKTQNLKSLYKQKLANIEELKKSILKKAFSGEL